MKCRNCGAELDLLDKVCPHCGSENVQSAGHLAEMEKYTADSKKAKGRLKKSLSENLPLVISAVVMALLLVGIGIASYVAENAFMFEHDARRAESLEKSEEYSAVLKQYLEDGDYTCFVSFKQVHVIPEYEKEYKEFEKVYDLAYEYCKVINSIEEGVLLGENGRRYSYDSYLYSCRSGIASFYYEYEQAMKDIDDGYAYRGYMEDMKVKADAAVKLYLGLDEKELEDYLKSSSNKQSAYLEEELPSE